MSNSLDEPVNSKIAKSCPTSTEVAFDREAYFDDWIPNVVGALLPNGITLTTTDMIADKNGVAVIMEGDAEGINGEYDNKYAVSYTHLTLPTKA